MRNQVSATSAADNLEIVDKYPKGVSKISTSATLTICLFIGISTVSQKQLHSSEMSIAYVS